MGQNLVPSQEFKWLAEMSFGANDFDDAQSGGRGELPDQLSIKDNVFTFKTSEGMIEAPNPRLLYFVYLGGKKPKSRALYSGAFNDDDLQAPVCTSQDGVNFEPGSQPPVITDPSHPRCGQETRNCRECPMSKWGSAVSVKTGKAVPACKEHKDIVVKVMGVTGAWLFKLPPAAFVNWDKATAKLRAAIEGDKAAHGGQTALSVGNCIFTVAFGPGMGNLIFEPKGYVQGDELLEVVELRRDQDNIDKMLWGPEGTARKLQYEEGKAPAASTAAQAAPVTAPAAAPVAPAPQAQKDMAKLAAAQAHIREAAQAASAALEAKQDATPPAAETKKAAKPAKAVDINALLAKMGLPGD